jgi:hypothetical protein
MQGCLTIHNHTPNLFQIGPIARTNNTTLTAMSPVNIETLDLRNPYKRSLILIGQLTLHANAVSTMSLWQRIQTRLSWIHLPLFPYVSIVMPVMTMTHLNARIRVSLWNVPVNWYYRMLTKIAPGLELNLTNFSSDLD